MRILILIFSFIFLTSCNFSRESIKESIIVDVRTSEEWEQDGHAACAVNYPLDQFESKIDELKEYKNVILVCRSGNRAEQAKLMLENKGYQHAENKGAWQNIECEK
jgi:rhodanese-related sulfurtransferase